MELAGEDGSVLELKEGTPLVLGRVAGLSHHDGSVSRHQVVVDLLRPSSRKGKEVIGQSLGLKLQVQVVGRNPICVVNRGTEEKGRPKVKFLCNGQKDWLTSGDQISLSIKRPFFYELRFEGRSSASLGNASLDTKVSKTGIESTPNRKGGKDAQFTSMDEEEVIAEAVARRTKVNTNGAEKYPAKKIHINDELRPMDEDERIGQSIERCTKVSTNGDKRTPVETNSRGEEDERIAEAVTRRTKVNTGGVETTQIRKNSRDEEEEGYAQPVARRRKVNTDEFENSTVKSAQDAKIPPMDEEEGIAEAVARRQRRRLEGEGTGGNSSTKRQHQAANGVFKAEQHGNDEIKVEGHKEESAHKAASRKVENGEHAVGKHEEAINPRNNGSTSSLDPVKGMSFSSCTVAFCELNLTPILFSVSRNSLQLQDASW